MATKKKSAGASRPRARVSGVRERAQRHAAKALKKLVDLVDSKNERVALSAAQTVLDRAHGKVAQAMNLNGTDGGLTVKIVRFNQKEQDNAG